MNQCTMKNTWDKIYKFHTRWLKTIETCEQIASFSIAIIEDEEWNIIEVDPVSDIKFINTSIS